MKRHNKILSLNRETVRQLANGRLAAIAGGVPKTNDSCIGVTCDRVASDPPQRR